MKKQMWMSYDVNSDGQVNCHKFYDPGHSIKCKWTAFIHELENGGAYHRKTIPDIQKTWVIVEETDTRKIVKYNDRYISHTVFQLIEIDVVERADIQKEESAGGYCTLGECIATGRHLTDCDEDGYCSFCGEQDG